MSVSTINCNIEHIQKAAGVIGEEKQKLTEGNNTLELNLDVINNINNIFRFAQDKQSILMGFISELKNIYNIKSIEINAEGDSFSVLTKVTVVFFENNEFNAYENLKNIRVIVAS